MNLMRTTKPGFDRRALATQAMQAAIACRAKAKLDQHGPICIYGLCETLGVTVRFNSINLEGMYQRGTPPRIHLSAHRPLPRRASRPVTGGLNLVISAAVRGFFGSTPRTARDLREKLSVNNQLYVPSQRTKRVLAGEWIPSASGLAGEFGNRPTSSRIFVATEPLTFLQPKTIAALSLSLLVH